MIKSAFMTEESDTVAVMQTSGSIAADKLPTKRPTISGRFPPIENALTEIIKNKRLSEAQTNV